MRLATLTGGRGATHGTGMEVRDPSGSIVVVGVFRNTNGRGLSFSGGRLGFNPGNNSRCVGICASTRS